MKTSGHVCLILWLVLPACLAYSEYHSSSYSSSASSGVTKKSTKVKKENGVDVHYCLYKDMKFLPGSSYTDYEDCVRCECSEKWLTCTKLEANANFYKHSSGSNIKSKSKCASIKVGCETKWVLKADRSTDCPKAYIPEEKPDYSWSDDVDFDSDHDSDFNDDDGFFDDDFFD